MWFLIRSAAALAVLYALSLTLETTPVISLIRGVALGGIALAGIKLVLKRYGVPTRPKPR